MATITDTIKILSPKEKKTKFIKNSFIIGGALEWMIMQAPFYDASETNFAIPEDQIINPDSISICSIYGKLGVLFNWVSKDQKREYSVVVLSSDPINFKEIKKIFSLKTDLEV